MKEYRGIYRGVVEDVNDPLKIGRCRIRVPAIHGKLNESQIPLLPWARYICPLPTGMKRGSFILPKKGDIVYLFFEGGDKLDPVYIGSSYGIVNKVSEIPLEESDDYLNTDVVYSSSMSNGTPVQIRKEPSTLKIFVGDTNISLAEDGSISIGSASKIDIHSKKDISIKSNTKIDISAPRINLN